MKFIMKEIENGRLVDGLSNPSLILAQMKMFKYRLRTNV